MLVYFKTLVEKQIIQKQLPNWHDARGKESNNITVQQS